MILSPEEGLSKFIAETSPVSYLYLACSHPIHAFASIVKYLKSHNIEHSANFDAQSIQVGTSCIQLLEPHMAGIFRGCEFDAVILDIDVIIKESKC